MEAPAHPRRSVRGAPRLCVLTALRGGFGRRGWHLADALRRRGTGRWSRGAADARGAWCCLYRTVIPRALLLDELALRDVTLFIANTGLPTGLEHPTEAFLASQEFSQTTPDFNTGVIFSMAVVSPLTPEVQAAYDAPLLTTATRAARGCCRRWCRPAPRTRLRRHSKRPARSCPSGRSHS